MFFLRHRRGNSPLTLSSPISGACHFGPSSHSQLESVQHGGSAVGHECCSALTGRDDWVDSDNSAMSVRQFAPQTRAARLTQHPLNGKGIKPFSFLISDSGSSSKRPIRSLNKTRRRVGRRKKKKNPSCYIASYRTGWSQMNMFV